MAKKDAGEQALEIATKLEKEVKSVKKSLAELEKQIQAVNDWSLTETDLLKKDIVRFEEWQKELKKWGDGSVTNVLDGHAKMLDGHTKTLDGHIKTLYEHAKKLNEICATVNELHSL